jgi:hypothetical protein
MYKHNRKPFVKPKGKMRPSLASYIKEKEARKSILCRLYNGEMKVFFEGEWITEKQFNEVWPIPTIVNFFASTSNPCKKNVWQFQ